MATSLESVKSAALAIFAKAPIAGFAKTRLIPVLGEEGASDLQRELIEHAVGVAVRAAIGPVSLWCAPSGAHECFRSLAAYHQLTLYDQIDGDLGARMHHAFTVLTKSHPAILMGTDCTVLTTGHLRWAANALQSDADVVSIPVEDGGYVLIGLRNPSPSLFDAMPWSSSLVMAETRSRARAAGLCLREIDELWDIDRPEDLSRLRASDGFPGSGFERVLAAYRPRE